MKYTTRRTRQFKRTSANRHDLYGVWELVSLQSVMSDGGAPTDTYGADPVGRIIFTAENLMVTVITAKDRSSSKDDAGDGALFRSMMAYSGPFRVEGHDRFITTVDVAWNPEWVGTVQVRNFSIEGEILAITTSETVDPMAPGRTGHGVITWRRIAS